MSDFPPELPATLAPLWSKQRIEYGRLIVNAQNGQIKPAALMDAMTEMTIRHNRELGDALEAERTK